MNRITVETARLAITFYDDFYFAKRFAAKHADILAIIEIESGFDADAYRDEPRLHDASYGLMQLLYSTAKDRGFTGPTKGLFHPDINIRYGMAQIEWISDYLLHHNITSWEKVIVAYNEGVGNVVRNVPDPEYLARWKEARKRYS
jgi:soluble lytic murein transglycosylase-like protein